MGKFRSPNGEPRDPSWYNFPTKVLSNANRLRVQWGRPETPGTWRRIVDYLHRAGFPAYDAEKLRLAVLDFNDRFDTVDPPEHSKSIYRGPANRSPPHPAREASSSRVVDVPPEEGASSDPQHSEPPVPEPVRAKSREEVDASWEAAWAEEFPGEVWPGVEKAILLIQEKARQQRRRRF